MGERRTKFEKAMDDAGISVAELAARSGFSQGYIYKLRRGEQKPSIDAAETLAGILGVSISVFSSVPDSQEATVLG